MPEGEVWDGEGVRYTQDMDDVKPVMSWDDKPGFKDACVWWGRLDGRWQIEVHRVSPKPPSYEGILHIFDHNDDDKLVYSEQVTLAYEARFGPDVADVSQWQEIAIRYVDSLENDKPDKTG